MLTKYYGINFATDLTSEQCCDNMIEVAVKSMTLMEHELANYELKGIDELITITTKKVGLLDKKEIKYLYETGYKITKKYLDDKMKE